MLRKRVMGGIQKDTEFKWTAQRDRAARLLAEDELTDEMIGEAVGVKRDAVAKWKRHPDFALRMSEYIKALEAETLKFAIAKRRKRVAALDDRWARMQAVIDARGSVYAEDVAGGETGLLVKLVRAIGNGDRQVITEEYAVDTGLLKELREHEKQAAQEIGQWLDKTEVTTPGGAFSIVFEVIDGRDPKPDE